MSTISRLDSVKAADHRAGNDASLWDIELLDVDAYLGRVGYDGDLTPTANTLNTLHRAHTMTIPFENLDIMLGRGISLELGDIQNKLVRHQRGGYCFEHNLLFAALLERLGFTVRRHLGRVLSADPNRPQPRTHMTLNVDIENATWHADVGFGTALSEPIPLADAEVSTQGGWSHALARHEDDSWALRSLGPEGWSDRYIYTQEWQYHIDFVAANHYTSTHPDSHFVQRPVAVRLTPRERYRLNGLELSTATPDGVTERRQVPEHALAGVLRDIFDIELSSDEMTRLRTRI